MLVRYGERDWIVVDSFLSRKKPAALRYLDRLRVDHGDVRLALATHWHDDHVRGLDRVLKAAPGAKFAFPDVDDRRDLVTLAAEADEAASADLPGRRSSFAKVLEVLKRNGRQAIPAKGGTLIVRNRSRLVLALSPTTAAKTAGMINVGRELLSRPRPARRGGRGSATAVARPNLTSIVLWIETPTHAALLGADLESDESFGWPAAIDETAPLRAYGPGQVLKVPHHGSRNADHERVWQELLEADAHAAFTPYAPADLPRSSDVARLRNRTGRLRGAASSARASAAPSEIRTAYPRAIGGESLFGYVHYRAEAGGWSAESGYMPVKT